MVFVEASLGTIEMIYMVPNGVSSSTIGQLEMVYMVLYGICSSSIGHHKKGLYGAQWRLFNHYWAP